MISESDFYNFGHSRMASSFVFWQGSILTGKSLVNVLLSAGTDQGIRGLWIATVELCHLTVKQLSFHLENR